MSVTRFGIVGCGWRAEFYLRVAGALPQRFRVVGVVDAEPAAAARAAKTFGVKAFESLDEMLEAEPAFVAAVVPRTAMPKVLTALAHRGVPALCETPPAADITTMVRLCELADKGARIQVAEQYAFQPLLAAQLAVARSGKVGDVVQAQVSVAHEYHGISLIRKFLGVGFEEATIQAFTIPSPVVEGPGRDGAPKTEQVHDWGQTIACLDFGGRAGIYDFTYDQYFGWIRHPRVLLRGARGQVQDARVHYLKNFRTPIQMDLVRQDAGLEGNLEGYHHKGILAGEKWIYKNPFAPARLSDDEIAVATVLDKMGRYARGGDEFYPLAEGAQDQYLSLMIAKAVRTGRKVVAKKMPWANG